MSFLLPGRPVEAKISLMCWATQLEPGFGDCGACGSSIVSTRSRSSFRDSPGLERVAVDGDPHACLSSANDRVCGCIFFWQLNCHSQYVLLWNGDPQAANLGGMELVSVQGSTISIRRRGASKLFIIQTLGLRLGWQGSSRNELV